MNGAGVDLPSVHGVLDAAGVRATVDVAKSAETVPPLPWTE